MSTAVRASWRSLEDMLVRRSLEQGLATVLILDGISPTEALSLADALAAARLAGAVVLAIFSLHASHLSPGLTEAAPSPAPASSSPTSALPTGGATALPPPFACVEFALPEIPLEETRFLIGTFLRTLAEAGTGDVVDGGGGGGGGGGALMETRADQSSHRVPTSLVALCEERVSYVLERVHHPRAACAGLPLYVKAVCALALMRGPSAVSAHGLPPDVSRVWQEHVMPALEGRHGRFFVMWVLLALQYEPTGLLQSQIRKPDDHSLERAGSGQDAEDAGMGHPKDWLSPDESCSQIAPEAEALLADMTALLGRSFTPGGQCVVLESASAKQAVDKRYFEPWKRAEEEAAKPAVPGAKKGNLAAMSLAPSRSVSKQVSVSPPAAPDMKGTIRARKNLKGVNALVQRRLMELFDNVVDAFTFLDQNGDESISIVELGHGFKRMGITGLDMKKLGAAIAADGLVDLYEFLRLFAWQDIPNVEKEIKNSRPRHRAIVEQAAVKRKSLPELSPPVGAGAAAAAATAKKRVVLAKGTGAGGAHDGAGDGSRSEREGEVGAGAATQQENRGAIRQITAAKQMAGHIKRARGGGKPEAGLYGEAALAAAGSVGEQDGADGEVLGGGGDVEEASGEARDAVEAEEEGEAEESREPDEEGREKLQAVGNVRAEEEEAGEEGGDPREDGSEEGEHEGGERLGGTSDAEAGEEGQHDGGGQVDEVGDEGGRGERGQQESFEQGEEEFDERNEGGSGAWEDEGGGDDAATVDEGDGDDAAAVDEGGGDGAAAVEQAENSEEENGEAPEVVVGDGEKGAAEGGDFDSLLP